MPRPNLVLFLRSVDGGLVLQSVKADEAQLERLRLLLDGLANLGLIFCPVIAPPPHPVSVQTLLAVLRSDLGEIAVDAVLDAGPQAVARREPPPAMIAPVWPFEPGAEGDDSVLVSSLRLYGVDLKLEARRTDPDETEQATISIPGHSGEYLVFAEPV